MALRNIQGIGSGGRAEIVEALDALDADTDRLCELSFDVFTTPVRLRALERLECTAPRLRAPQHALVNQLGAQAGEGGLGGTLRSALADRLPPTKAEASRRIDEAEDLGQPHYPERMMAPEDDHDPSPPYIPSHHVGLVVSTSRPSSVTWTVSRRKTAPTPFCHT